MDVNKEERNYEANDFLKNFLELQGSQLYTFSLEVFNKSMYEDVTAMINSSVPTLIDVDSLLLYAVLQESHPIIAGNQFLHVTYMIERYLDLLTQKGATCVLIFFNFWELVWERNFAMRTLRYVIYNHFKNNTNIPTYSFSWYYSPQFCEFISKEKPRCIITSLGFDTNIKKFNKQLHNDAISANEECAQKLFCAGLVYCIANDLPIIDTDSINIGVTLIYAFNISPTPLSVEICRKFENDCLNELDLWKRMFSKRDRVPIDVKSPRELIIEAGALFCKSFNDENKLRLLFLYYAVQFILPLENRAPPKKLENEIIKRLQDFINNWHDCLFTVLSNKTLNQNKFDYELIADLWQGTLFMCVLHLTTDFVENKTQLGALHNEYEKIVADVNSRTPELDQINPYPIKPIFNTKYLVDETEKTDAMIKLSKIDNPLINRFCDKMFDEIYWRNPIKVLDIKRHKETRHWHHRNPLEETHLNATHNTSIKEQRRCQSMSYYSHIYGRNLEGSTAQYKSLIYQDPNKKETTTKKKQSGNTKKIQEQIQRDKAKEALEKEKKELKAFKQTMNAAGDIAKLKNDLHYISTMIGRLSCIETIIKGNIMKLNILNALVSNENSENKVYYIKEILLLIRSLLQKRDERNELSLSQKHQKYVSKLLHLYGFKDIAQKNNLPFNESYKEEHNYNFIRFQMEHLGADLIIGNSEPFDEDVNFAPDKWQVEFIEAIRYNESALVVAPTSSGKTFASYYCMKRVLQYSADGVVVYVAPTKALVNQVAATIAYRFKNFKLANNTAIIGVFTRDVKFRARTSRILITVPTCLDILLLCPSNFEWKKKIQYVIFDEVHRLSGNEVGLVWERLLLLIRCPFLALSATISDSNLFHNWLQSIQEYKKEQDKSDNCLRSSYKVHCVIHEERHADLIKYVYSEKGLQHYHPYCALHQKILLDRKRIPESITLSPKETIQLYDVLWECAQQYVPHKLNYLNYFMDRTEFGFLTRKSVRDYEKELGNIFYKIYEQNEEILKSILAKLSPPGYESQSSRYTSLEDGKKLLNHMAENNMLPAIVFSYNRKFVEEFCEYMLPDTDTNTVNKSRREIKVEKRLLKMKQNLESKKKKGGNNSLEFDDIRESLPEAAVNRKRFPINILARNSSKFKGVGIVDHEDLEFLEGRLNSYLTTTGNEFRELTIRQLQHGIAYHHAGVKRKLRDTVEMLFRIGVVRVVIATGTLAVGVHMPCKSVVIYGDSPFLNSLEFHQMAGRAGRRGFDTEGNVIFLNLTKKMHDTLLTDKLPKMLGNYPMKISLLVRLLLLVAGPTSDKVPTKEYISISLNKALTILENSLLFEIKPHLKQQVKLFIGFALQLLLIQEIITSEGIPTRWSCIIIQMHYNEPANMVLLYLIRSGALAELVENTEDDVDLQWRLVVVMAHLFTDIPLSDKHLEQRFNNSVVKLDPLPDCIKKSIINYNREVKFVFNEYFLNVAKQLRTSLGDDNILPLSKVTFKANKNNFLDDPFLDNIKRVCYQREIISTFVALSGNEDTNLNTHQLISNIRHDFCPDIKIVPEYNVHTKLNGYALDFYRHGLPSAINKENNLRQGNDYSLLYDFALILRTITLALEDFKLEGEVNARLLQNFQVVSDKYYNLFRNAYILKK